MASLGSACLLLALAVCVYGIGASLYGVRRARPEWSDSGRRAVYALAGVLTVAFAVLELAFLRDDFAFNTVADTSSATTPTFYKAAAVWSSQEGSLLLWAWLLSMWSSLVLFLTGRRMREVAAYATAILLGFGGFFVSLMIFYANPFQTTRPAPVEGAGLDPLLRFPTMMIHPPMLYSGYTLCTIPLAFGMGALLARRVDAEWIRAIRRFAFAAWFFLGIGILLGARWSYAELGWGGYWGWDAVENASLMPWLTGTAFLHSLMIQEKRGMLKVWNASLVLATGTLAIMGTFLVRSGVLSSIHAFGGQTLGVPFVCLIAALIAGSIYLVVTRREMLASEHRLDSLLSRESVFLANNVVLVALCFVIFWGTYFPLISEALTGRAASVGPPWFDRYTVPLALILVLLSGIGPVISWRRATLAGARRSLLAPVGIALSTVAALLLAGVSGRPFALAMFGCAAFVLACVGQEFVRGARARRAMAGEAIPVALAALVRRNRRRYGGYVVHVGIAVLFVGVAASSSFQHALEPTLSVGQSSRVGAYTVHYVRPTATVTPSNDAAHTGATLSLGAVLNVSKHGRHVATLYPSEGYYASGEPSQGSVGSLIGGQPVSHVAMSAGVTRDVWSAIAPNIETAQLKRVVEIGNRTIPFVHPEEALIAVAVLARTYLQHPPPAQFHFIVSPLVMWIWIGGLIVFGGGLIAIWPTGGGATDSVRRRVRVAGLSALELERDAKYREIREAELDYRIGKLSRADYEAVDATLRAEAIAILDQLEPPAEPVEEPERRVLART
ncbi:MAG TPA: cytochrome c-type biogenesis CcmF C-terminal domain-containing protein [Solirubrobacteraceae bacterium]|jgi:cytochrome c-type biogenesis protein CcmF|nr:cytochrome c-type biogenesis CcmF C-terminal domain-containing protein [Solirubrobacteraceae bacterium]